MGFLILILPTAVFAQAKGQVLTVGFNNHYRPDCWTPMLVQLSSMSDQSTVYQIQVAQDDLDRDKVIYTQMVTLGGNVEGKPATTENFWVYFRPKPTERGLPDATDVSSNLNTLNAKLKVFLCDKNGKPISTLPMTATVFNTDPVHDSMDPRRGRKLVLTVTDGLDKPIFPDYSGMKGLVEDVDNVVVQPRDLPSNVIGYDAVDAIVWMDADANFLQGGTRTPAMEALRQWVHQGGHLIVCQPAESFKIKPFADMLPVGGLLNGEWAIPVADRTDIDILNQLAHPGGIGKPWPTNNNSFKVARVPALNDAKVEEWMSWTDSSGITYSPWLARRGVGLGAVTWVAQDLGNPALTSKSPTGWRFIWDRIFDWNNATVAEDYRPLDPTRDPWMDGNARDLGAGTISGMDLSNKAAAYISISLLFFVLYWLVAGPGVYFYLLARKRSHLSWFAFGLSAVVATGLTVIIVKAVVRGPPVLKHFSIIRHAAGEADGIIDSRFGLYIPQDGGKQIELQKTADHEVSYVTPFAMHPQFVVNDDENAAYLEYEIPVRDPSETDPVSVSIPYRSSSKKLQARWVGQIKGEIQVPDGAHDIKLIPPGNGGYLEGTLVNKSGYDLVQIYMAFQEPRGFETGGVSTRDVDWLVYLPEWPKDGAINLKDVMKAENLINLDATGARRPDQNMPAFGEMGNGLSWDRYWKRSDVQRLDTAIPMLTLFERLVPWRADQIDQKSRFEFFRHNARDLDLSAAMSAGQLVIVGTTREGLNDTMSPLPIPMTVSGDPVPAANQSGRTIVQFVLPLDKSAMYKSPTAIPASTAPSTRP